MIVCMGLEDKDASVYAMHTKDILSNFPDNFKGPRLQKVTE